MRFTEEGRPEISGKEYRTVWFCLMVESELHHAMKDFCEERKALVPDFDERIKELYDKMISFNQDLLMTVPNKNLARLKKELPLMDHEIRLKPISTPPAEWILLRDVDVNELLKTVVQDKCPYCDFAMALDKEDEKKIQQCPLRKALMRIQPPEELDTAQCPYSQLTWATRDELREKEIHDA